MKLFGALASLLFALAPAAVESHGTEVRWCITTEIKLRIFVEHWHNALTSANQAGQMTLQDTDGFGDTIYPDSFINNIAAADLHTYGCREPQTVQASKCTEQAAQNDWVYFDFEMTCDEQVTYTLQQGMTVYLEEGCANLYPAVVSGLFSCSNPPTDSPAPSDSPTAQPSKAPSNAPTITGSRSPTTDPSSQPSATPTDQPSSHAPSATPSDQPSKAPSDGPTVSPSMEPSSAFDNDIGPATDGNYLEMSWYMEEPEITYNSDGNWYRLNWTVNGWQDAFESNEHINEDFYDDQCKDDGDHTEYRVTNGIINYGSPAGKPQAYRDSYGNIILDFEILPEILTTQPEVYQDNLDGTGQLDMCVRSSIGYNGTDDQSLGIDEQRAAGYREINFIESLLTIVYDLTGDFVTVSAQVKPKDRQGTTEAEDNYSLVAWICDTTTTVSDAATNFARSYPGQLTGVFEQGDIVPVCIRPDTLAYEEGIVMRDLQSFQWTRGTIVQPAMVSGGIAANRLTFHSSCDGADYCMLSSILFADFFSTAGSASGDGSARVKFQGSARRLVEENSRLLQEESSSPFDVDIALAVSDDGPMMTKTAGGASLGFTVLASCIAFICAGLLA